MQKLEGYGSEPVERCRIADGGGRPHAQTSSGAAGTRRGDHTQECSGTVGGSCAEH